MKRRQGRLWRCRHDGKHAYSSWRMADHVAGRADDPGYVYWCPAAGGYHITRLSPGEYDQRRAAYLAGVA